MTNRPTRPRPYGSVLFAFLLATTACTSGNDLTKALDEARRLTQEGKYEQALQKHILFHDHILDADRSFYGVRLSFALVAWVELGEKYPKARKVLIEIRDKKAKQLQNGDRNRALFHDVESINDYLKESEATVALFKKMEEASPEFATTIYDLADEALVQAGEYAMARKYLGDPLAKFNRAKENLERGIAFSKRSSAGEASRTAFENIFTERTLRIITILKNSGEISVAKTVQSEALKSLDSSELREAIP